MTEREFKLLKAKLEDLKREKIRMETKKEELEKKMKEMGFNGIDEVEQKIEDLQKEKVKLSEKLEILKKQAEKILERNNV